MQKLAFITVPPLEEGTVAKGFLLHFVLLFLSEFPEETWLYSLLSSQLKKAQRRRKFVSSFVKVRSALGFICNDPQGEESAGTPTMQRVCCFPSVTLGRSALKTLRCFLGMLLHTLLPPAKRAL